MEEARRACAGAPVSARLKRSKSAERGLTMPDKTYKIVDVVGVSEESIQQAVRNAMNKASQTLRNIDWFEVRNIRGAMHGTSGLQFQVEVRIGFRLEGDPV